MTLKRKPGESFDDYKKRRKTESADAKKRSRGTVVWNSSNIIPKPGGTIGELVKVRNQGTFMKPLTKYHRKLRASNRKPKEGDQENAET